MKTGKIPTLVDTEAQIPCVSLDFIDYFYERGERCTFVPCNMTYLLAVGSKAQFSGAVWLHVRLLSFCGFLNIRLRMETHFRPFW